MESRAGSGHARPAVALEAGDHLGEGPTWDVSANELIRVDINRGLVHRWNPDTGTARTLDLGPPISFAIPCLSGGLVVGRQQSIWRVNDGGDGQQLAELEERPDDVRFNDAKCDAAGRLWAGTMSTTRRRGAGALYRLAEGATLEKVVENTTISNGIGWSPDSSRMYFIDSPAQRIDEFEFNLGDGTLGDRGVLTEISAEAGLPDGLTVDADGHLWICLFGGGAVREYAPDGNLQREIPLPTSNPTSPCFGGRDHETLYVTTAKHRLSAEQLQAEPLAGALFALSPGVRGLPAHAFTDSS